MPLLLISVLLAPGDKALPLSVGGGGVVARVLVAALVEINKGLAVVLVLTAVLPVGVGGGAVVTCVAVSMLVEINEWLEVVLAAMAALSDIVGGGGVVACVTVGVLDKVNDRPVVVLVVIAVVVVVLVSAVVDEVQTVLIVAALVLGRTVLDKFQRVLILLLSLLFVMRVVFEYSFFAEPAVALLSRGLLELLALPEILDFKACSFPVHPDGDSAS